MKRIYFLAGAAFMLGGVPAVAQMTQASSDASAPAAAPAPDSNTPAQAPTDAGTPSPTPASGAPAPAPAAPAGPDPAKVQAAQQAVEAGWSKYDEGAKGFLAPLEFGEWIMAAQGQDVTTQISKSKTGKASSLPAIKVLNATAAEFAKADTNHDRQVSKEELIAYLAGGPGS